MHRQLWMMDTAILYFQAAPTLLRRIIIRRSRTTMVLVHLVGVRILSCPILTRLLHLMTALAYLSLGASYPHQSLDVWIQQPRIFFHQQMYMTSHHAFTKSLDV